MGFNNCPGDRKTQPRSRYMVAARRFDPEIFFKKRDEVFRGDAHALVDDVEAQNTGEMPAAKSA